MQNLVLKNGESANRSVSERFEDYKNKYGELDFRTLLLQAASDPNIYTEAIRNIQARKPSAYELCFQNDKPLPIYEDIRGRRIGRRKNNDLVFDPETLGIVIEFRDRLISALPEVVMFVDSVITSEEKIVTYMQTAGADKIQGHIIKDISAVDIQDLEDIETAKVWGNVFMKMGGIASKLETVIGRSVKLQDSAEIWPPEIRARLRNEFSDYELLQLCGNIASLINLAVKRGVVPNESMNDVNTMLTDDVVRRVSPWITRIPELVDREVIRKFLPNYDIPEHALETIRMNLMTHRDREVYLAKDGVSSVVTLDFYAKYKESCKETEIRLIRELNNGEALLLRLNYQNNSVLLAVKFEEVTLVAVIQSSDPHLQEGYSYLPLGQVAKDLEQIRDQEQLRYDAVSLPLAMVPLVFARNRSLNYPPDQWDDIKAICLQQETRLKSTS